MKLTKTILDERQELKLLNIEHLLENSSCFFVLVFTFLSVA